MLRSVGIEGVMLSMAMAMALGRYPKIMQEKIRDHVLSG